MNLLRLPRFDAGNWRFEGSVLVLGCAEISWSEGSMGMLSRVSKLPLGAKEGVNEEEGMPTGVAENPAGVLDVISLLRLRFCGSTKSSSNWFSPGKLEKSPGVLENCPCVNGKESNIAEIGEIS